MPRSLHILFNAATAASLLLALTAALAFALAANGRWQRGGWGAANVPWQRLTLTPRDVTFEHYTPGPVSKVQPVWWQHAGVGFDNADAMVPLPPPDLSQPLPPIAAQQTTVTYHPGWRLTVPLWLLAAPAFILPPAHVWDAHRRANQKPPGHCPRCGYDLRATPHRCPECGATPKPPALTPPSP